MSFKKAKLSDFPYFPNDVIIDLSINLDSGYILPGCQKPDCIPSIDNPQWIIGSDALEEYKQEEEILALFIIDENQVKSVYGVPITILDYHEIVNFTSDRIPIAMAYCPLCQTATVYSRILDGKMLEFGVSGLLFNSALIIYDRISNSLFSQVWSKGIVGKYSGKKLSQYPLIQTTLEQLLELHPDAMILSKQTGFERQMKKYGKYPYRDYKTTQNIHFPVEFQDDKLHPKSLVYHIDLNDGSDNYIIPNNELSGTKQHTPDFYSINYAGGRLFFKGNKENLVEWKNWIPSGISFYFAVRAYYPNSVLLK